MKYEDRRDWILKYIFLNKWIRSTDPEFTLAYSLKMNMITTGTPFKLRCPQLAKDLTDMHEEGYLARTRVGNTPSDRTRHGLSSWSYRIAPSSQGYIRLNEIELSAVKVAR